MVIEYKAVNGGAMGMAVDQLVNPVPAHDFHHGALIDIHDLFGFAAAAFAALLAIVFGHGDTLVYG